MVSLPTRGTSLRLTASSATSRTVQRARPSGGLLHTIAIKRCFCLSSSTSAAPGRCLSYSAPIQTALLITVADVSNTLWRQRYNAGNSRCPYASCQLQKRQGTQHDSDLLDSAAHQLPEFLLILGGHFNPQGWTSHTLSMCQNISDWNCLIANSSSGQRPSSNFRTR